MSYYNRVMEVEKAPLFDRKEAAAEFFKAMRDDPNLVAERIGWLIGGNYGREERDAAVRVLRMRANANKTANLNCMIAVLEWQCPPKACIAAWKKLTSVEKAQLDKAIKAEITSALEEEKINPGYLG